MKTTFSLESMLPKKMSMICCKDNNRFIRNPEFVEFIEYFSNILVHHTDHTVVGRCQLPMSFFCCLMRMVAMYPFTSFIITRRVWRFFLRHLEVRWVFFMFTFNTFWNGQVIWIKIGRASCRERVSMLVVDV